MIQEQVNTFMALSPLMAPSLITKPSDDDSEITEEYALLYFPLEEKLPIGMVSDMCLDSMELLSLFFAKSKVTPGVQHCCLFHKPSGGKLMFKIDIASDSIGFVSGITVTIFDEHQVFEQALEDDLTAHSSSFTFEHSIPVGDVLKFFCKL